MSTINTNARELLELAAKAAGLKIDKSPDNGGGIGNDGFDMLGNVVLDWHNGVTWNPLTDDGDALRLTVKLRLGVLHNPMGVAVYGPHGPEPLAHEQYGDDPNAATRRAITRAAAAIGRTAPAGG
jgi:hypothetical protein